MPPRPASATTPAPGAEVIVEHLRKSYGEQVTALRDVSFRVAAGEFVLLTGRSGSGKSTVLNMIARLDRPDGGRVLVDGRDVTTVRDVARYRREDVGIVFQLHHLLSGLTAEENVEVVLLPTAIGRRERRDRARAALADVGLAARASHLPDELSGGERQRVAIARAIVARPRLLLADEPTGALDSQTSREILALLQRLRSERGMTVLLVSYEPEAVDCVDRVLYLQDGRIDSEQAVALPLRDQPA